MSLLLKCQWRAVCVHLGNFQLRKTVFVRIFLKNLILIEPLKWRAKLRLIWSVSFFDFHFYQIIQVVLWRIIKLLSAKILRIKVKLTRHSARKRVRILGRIIILLKFVGSLILISVKNLSILGHCFKINPWTWRHFPINVT